MLRFGPLLATVAVIVVGLVVLYLAMRRGAARFTEQTERSHRRGHARRHPLPRSAKK